MPGIVRCLNAAFNAEGRLAALSSVRYPLQSLATRFIAKPTFFAGAAF
jgi:hypothetical protein